MDEWGDDLLRVAMVTGFHSGMPALPVTREEYDRLDKELEETSHKLNDVWLVLDHCARSGVPLAPMAAEALLRHQMVPGWKVNVRGR